MSAKKKTPKKPTSSSQPGWVATPELEAQALGFKQLHRLVRSSPARSEACGSPATTSKAANEPPCPQHLDQTMMPFVADGVLHCRLLCSGAPGLPQVPAAASSLSSGARSVFLDQETMSLCHLGFGDLVQITFSAQEIPGNSAAVVFRCWPLSASSSLQARSAWCSALVSPNGLRWITGPERLDEAPPVTIEKWIGQEGIASEVALALDATSDSEGRLFSTEIQQPQGILGAAALCLQDAVIREGSLVPINYYGKWIVLRTDLIKGPVGSKNSNGNEEADLALRLGQMDLTQQQRFFSVTNDTKLRLLIKNGASDSEDVKALGSQDGKAELLPPLGGLQEEVETIMGAVRAFLNDPGRSYLGVLVYGPPGTGKTLLGRHLPGFLRDLELRTWSSVEIRGAELYSKFSGETESNLRAKFKEAKEKAANRGKACLILADEFDALCGSNAVGGAKSLTDQDRRVVSTLRNQVDDLGAFDSSRNSRMSGEEKARTMPKVLLVATTSRPDSIDPSFRRPGRLDLELELGVPSFEAKVDILRKLIKEASAEKEQQVLSDSEIETVARSAHGFVGADLKALCCQAFSHISMTSSSHHGEGYIEAFRRAMVLVKPSAMREIQVEVPNVSWADIGGLDELKLKLKQAVEWPLKHADKFKKMGISPPKGVLMYGPPGCSKTMVAKALANESGLNFLAVKGPELFSKWVGESEKAVRDLFRKARRVAPSIIFFDEIDALSSERGGSSSGGGKVGDRVLAQMLTEMDGVEQLGGVTVVAATNRPDMIDKALMRPGRLDRVVYVPLPDRPTRLKILQVHTRLKPIAPVVDLEQLSDQTGGYSGAEISAVCNEAAMAALEDLIASGKASSDIKAEPDDQVHLILPEHFQAALKIVRPRITNELLDVYKRFQEQERH